MPIGTVRSTPAVALTSVITRSVSSLTRYSSITEPTSGTMISGTTGLPVFLPASTAASKMARACISAISG